MKNKILERVQLGKFKHKHYSTKAIDTISQSNLVQLFVWLDKSKVIYKNNLFKVADNDKYIIYEHFVYNHYNGELFTPLQALEEFFGLPFPKGAYILNYFYYKVNKTEVEDYIKTNFKSLSTSIIKNGDVDLNYIIEEDNLNSSNKHYYYKRAIAYLCNNRTIDKDIVLNFIKQGFLKMDDRGNLCFITYKDALDKKEVIAITRKGTIYKDFKNIVLKEHFTGFFYAKKELLETKDFETVYVFESCVDLMSFLTLIKDKKLLLPENENCCYISLNGVGNRKYLQKILMEYPSINKVTFCLDNDNAGISGVERIKKDYVMCQIGTYPDLETIYRYDFTDLRDILKDISGKHGYCKDWNDVLKHSKSFSYDVSDYDL